MTIRVALHHRTAYRYDRAVHLSPQVIRLRPAPHARTPVVSYALKIEPAEHFLNWQQDPFGNFLARAAFPEKTRALVVEVDLLAELHVQNPFDFFLEDYAEEAPFTYDPLLAKELAPYLELEPAGPRLRSLLAELPTQRTRTIDFLVSLNQLVNRRIEYVIRAEPGVYTPEETLERSKGSCRDSAWLMVQLLRQLGFAARFASGYLIQLVADEKPLEGPAGTDRDFTDLHAWAEVFLPGAGWVGMDATSGLLTGEGHIPLACAPHPVSAAPISGSVDECETEFEVQMRVDRIHEDPRVTRPYTDAQWRDIDALGRAVDRRLRAGDVRLTTGGEPTFVGIDDPDAAEWNTDALGPTKRQRADDLVRRLHARLGPGGLLHFGQGKWYPGESLPRWAFGCYWRKDGEPIWGEPARFADSRATYTYGERDAARFIERLAKNLGVDPGFALPGYEDTWYWLWRERRLPINVDPHDARLEDAEERARFARVFEQGLGNAVGYALPIEVDPYASPDERGVLPWRSGRWFLRRERLYLLPGDSPMGYRLPLDSIPWAAPGDAPGLVDRDPFEPRPPLPAHEALRRHQLQGRSAAHDGERRADAGRRAGDARHPAPRRGPDGDPSPDLGESASWIVRTALCVEPRDGMLHVFMPPIRRLEEWLSLVSAIEAAAAQLDTPVRLEGYTPPSDPRLEKLEVTPDPGVIEVNVPPSSSWEGLVHQTETLYEEARLSRLRTEKFMLDGRHTGTGGGNHITLGGATAMDSPLLRRPDLLRSLIGYWQDHPALSYLFSGLFIGPTSQAPRVDEARSDSLYELEIALDQLRPRSTGSPAPAPWLVDRVLRHLLIDATGNTHRTEHCIDKLYSPDGPMGRLGLVELRAFEMPPHGRMSLVQQLLLRSLIARFWERPYEPRLLRWGTMLHDRFMLPHFVVQDFEDVLLECRNAGFALESGWFAPHVEFRFPKIGEVHHAGVAIELRHALEPWNVLGEEQVAAGTTRFVDSSVERLQVKVRGALGDRYAVTCNGRRVPLHPTGAQGEQVAGVRYRAWQPPSCLHPTIPVHAPLVFDVVDTWQERSLGGCTYHVAHPGGLAHERLPINANEAETRRGARFSTIGHTPGCIQVETPAVNRDFPFTLDLRRES